VAPTARPSYIAIARIIKPRGNRGEVLAVLHTDFPARIHLLKSVWLEFPDGRRASYALDRYWEHQGRPVLKFRDVDAIAEAQKLAGCWVEIEAEQAAPLPEGTYWDRDLIGCVLRDRSGKVVGSVRDVLRIAGNSQLVVAAENGEFLVPAVASICLEISIASKEILVDLPDGLVGLNQ
jgi:16S rRNA processing protein RimM